MRERLSGVLLDAGVDWITVTRKQEFECDSIRAIALSLAEVELSLGMYGKPARWSGYEGFQVGSVGYGERLDTVCVRLGSTAAQSHWQRVAEQATNITRLDLQATFRLTGPVGPMVQKHYKEMKTYAGNFKKKPLPSLFVGRDGSCTAYSGSRSSHRFGRIYDKGLETGLEQWRNCIRFEVEFKAELARKVAQGLNSNHSHFSTIAATVLAFFRLRGLHLKYLGKPDTAADTIVSSQVPRQKSDLEKTLVWLRQAVRPSIGRVLNRNRYSELEFALGVRLDH